jgi:putative glutamine amidotransferase
MTTPFPFVGLPADTYENHGFLFHSLGDKYVRAVAEVSKCTPLMIPSMIDAVHLDELLNPFDGILMTGAVSNVHPPHYGEEPTTDHEPYDHARDAITLKLIRAMGGSLETELQKGEGRLDHRAPQSDDTDVRYGPKHKIAITKGGMLERIIGKSETMVNSIHRQGVKKLAADLNAEAIAPDGIIEAVSVKGAKSFAFGTQWHPEYKAANNPDSVKLFTTFGDAVRAHYRNRVNGEFKNKRYA